MPDPVRESSNDSASPLYRRAYQSPAAIIRFVVPAILGLAADLWLKNWSFPAGPDHPGRGDMVVIPKILGFQTTINHGAVFGIGQGMAFYFLLFSILAMAMILWVFLTSRQSQWTVHVALGMITAGALGNLYDRAMFSGVRDMLHFFCFHFPPLRLFGGQFPSGPIAPNGTVDWYPYIFNIADVMLCVGVPLLILCWLFVKEPPKQNP